MDEFPPPMEELRALWTEDCQKLIPGFELFDEARFAMALEAATAEWEGTPSEIQVIAWVLRGLYEEQTGVPGHWWWLAAASIIFPQLQLTPWLQVAWQAAYEARGKREMLTFWGSASSGKSRFFSMIALTEMVIWVGCFHCYIASPFKIAGLDKIFRALKSETDEWAATNPHWMLDLGLKVTSNKEDLMLTDSRGLSSTASLVSLDTTASVRGKKSQRHPDYPWDDRRGRMMFIGDEIILNPVACENIAAAEGNLLSNGNVISMVGMNPVPHQVRHINAIDLSAPVEVSIDALNEHTDYTWKTLRGRLYRFCMDLSPNRHARIPVYDFLINHRQAEIATSRGEDRYKSEVAAWGWSGGMGNGGALTIEALNTPEWQPRPFWSKPASHWIFFDLAFGGSDPAGYTLFEFGTALENGANRDVISVMEQEKVHVQRLWAPTQAEFDEFTALVKARGGKMPPTLQPHVEAGPNAFMVLQMLRVSKQKGIPNGRIAFDSSMRTDVTIMARDALGSVPWYYDGVRPLVQEQMGWALWPPEIKGDGTPKLWTDMHQKTISAAWRLTENIIVRGHLRGLSKARKGTLEILSRMWLPSAAGNKMDVEGKKPMGSSPIWGETLALGLLFGIRYCGALPQLANEKALVLGTGGAFETHEAFKIRPRHLLRTWR